MKKKISFGILERFPTNVDTNFFFFHFIFRFLLKTEKNTNPPPPFAPHFGGGSSAASPLKIWDVMPPYLKTLFEQKTEI